MVQTALQLVIAPALVGGVAHVAGTVSRRELGVRMVLAALPARARR